MNIYVDMPEAIEKLTENALHMAMEECSRPADKAKLMVPLYSYGPI